MQHMQQTRNPIFVFSPRHHTLNDWQHNFRIWANHSATTVSHTQALQRACAPVSPPPPPSSCSSSPPPAPAGVAPLSPRPLILTLLAARCFYLLSPPHPPPPPPPPTPPPRPPNFITAHRPRSILLVHNAAPRGGGIPKPFQAADARWSFRPVSADDGAWSFLISFRSGSF